VRGLFEGADVRLQTFDQPESVNDRSSESDDQVGRHWVDLLNAELVDLDQPPAILV
jgi:hypothetical protein